ncbi:MAG: FAD-dependent oxidoreductase [Erysipelotrichaceae bacterium]|nr:FAD-dependent oxidoreductase [Erysipelotrichaceae bacterium]
MEKYDLVVIGAGNGGLMTACRASQMGLKVLGVERHNMPGGADASTISPPGISTPAAVSRVQTAR